jgi:hypothetical protein
MFPGHSGDGDSDDQKNDKSTKRSSHAYQNSDENNEEKRRAATDMLMAALGAYEKDRDGIAMATTHGTSKRR